MSKFFLYARKSTDTEEKQVASIPSQIRELKEFAQKENLEIVEIFIEAKTAKAPGRLIFNQMMGRVERDEVEGILAWNPDRLARNSVDGGRIIYLLDTGKLKTLKFPTYWFENTPQGKFMLSIAFGQSKYYIDALSENVKRGLREKLRKGEWPGVAPTGYLNDRAEKKIVIDPQRAEKVVKLFKQYSTGNYSIKDIRNFSRKLGLVSRKGIPLSVSNIQYILQNPFYYGVIKFNGELYEAVHKPIIPKQLFETCKEIMLSKSHPKSKVSDKFVFTNFLRCSECGCAITAEEKKGHHYYRCTKKRGYCSQKYLREENLVEQLKSAIQKVALKHNWKEKMLKQLDKDSKTENLSDISFAQNLKNKLHFVEEKLDKLLDSHLEGIVDIEEYQKKKAELLNQKLDLKQKLTDFERKGNDWLGQMRDWITEANQAENIQVNGDFSEMKNFLKKSGSNFLLNNKKVRFDYLNEWLILSQRPPHSTWLGGLDSDQDT